VSLTYIEDSTVRQVRVPQWSKHYAGEVDTCSVTYQGAQYRMKSFLDSLTKYQTLQYVDEYGNAYSDNGMFLIDWTTDDNPILPTATLNFRGLRNGAAQDYLPTDDITTQSASTHKEITDSTSVNYQKTISLSVTYLAARTSYKWVALSNPGSSPTYSTVRKQITTGISTNGVIKEYSGMVDADGDPTDTIPAADAIAVWNTFTARTQVSSFNVTEDVPGHVYVCESVADWLLQGV